MTIIHLNYRRGKARTLYDRSIQADATTTFFLLVYKKDIFYQYIRKKTEDDDKIQFDFNHNDN